MTVSKYFAMLEASVRALLFPIAPALREDPEKPKRLRITNKPSVRAVASPLPSISSQIALAAKYSEISSGDWRFASVVTAPVTSESPEKPKR